MSTSQALPTPRQNPHKGVTPMPLTVPDSPTTQAPTIFPDCGTGVKIRRTSNQMSAALEKNALHPAHVTYTRSTPTGGPIHKRKRRISRRQSALEPTGVSRRLISAPRRYIFTTLVDFRSDKSWLSRPQRELRGRAGTLCSAARANRKRQLLFPQLGLRQDATHPCVLFFLRKRFKRV